MDLAEGESVGTARVLRHYPMASGLGISASSGVSKLSVGGPGFRRHPGAFPPITPGERLRAASRVAS